MAIPEKYRVNRLMSSETFSMRSLCTFLARRKTWSVPEYPPAKLKAWSARVGWETLLNTRGTTWRKLTPQQQAEMNESKALRLMAEHPSLIKRPVLEHGKDVLVGFTPERYAELFAR